jgi:hypothetical protein
MTSATTESIVLRSVTDSERIHNAESKGGTSA